MFVTKIELCLQLSESEKKFPKKHKIIVKYFQIKAMKQLKTQNFTKNFQSFVMMTSIDVTVAMETN